MRPAGGNLAGLISSYARSHVPCPFEGLQVPWEGCTNFFPQILKSLERTARLLPREINFPGKKMKFSGRKFVYLSPREFSK
jgi:hypothetical protein